MKKSAGFIFIFLFILSSSAVLPQSKKEFKIPYEKYTLANGLNVILHVDKSDPMVAVNVLYHVGSAREAKGKTGFAHLFEHLMFNGSQFTTGEMFEKALSNLGGENNAGTGNDQTTYYETVPKNGLETALWLESNRMGWLLGKLDYKTFTVQQHVVQNEKRQGIDNVPYGNSSFVMNKLLYPENHPYNWQVMGSMEDLGNASLQDVVDFYSKWYSPNNATLVVAGDIDVANTKKLIEKYFNEIAPYGAIPKLTKTPAVLTEIRRAYYEDNFGNAPDLTMIFPTIEMYHKDSYALSYLGQLLGGSKKSPLYKIVVEEKKLAAAVASYNQSQEVAGSFKINSRAFPGKNLGELETAFSEAIKRFEKEGFTDKDLERLKTSAEIGFYNNIQSVLGKALRLSSYNTYAGSPDFLNTDIHNSLNVTKEDIWRVFNQYIKGKNFVLLSIVPKGKTDLAAPDSKVFIVPEESIDSQKKIEEKNVEVKSYEKPFKFDRTVQPPVGPDPVVNPPKIWTGKTANNMKLYGIRYTEVPLVQFIIEIDGGMLLDPKDKIGVANLTARLMNEGTKSKTAIERREAMQDLGASITFYAQQTSIGIAGFCLVSKLNGVLKLAKEMLVEPRWDEKEFALLKQQIIDNLKRNETRASTVANRVFNKLVYGADNILSNSSVGDIKSVESITIDDLKNYYKKYFSPATAKIMVVGDISKETAVKEFNLFKVWKGDKIEIPSEIKCNSINPGIYFVDMPNAKQSELRVGHLSLTATDSDFNKLAIINHKLGGDYISILNGILRQEKGFTYGASSYFTGTQYPGYFQANTSVQSNATLESLQIIKSEIAKYREGITPDALNLVRNTLLRGNASRYETMYSLLGMLSPIVDYNYPFDYIKKTDNITRKMTPEVHKALAQKYIHPDKMIYLIVGDKATQFDKLKELGLGDPILLDKEGKPVSK